MEKEIDETREAIEDLKEERLADMFSGHFENKDHVEKLSMEAAEKKMRQSEIERLEGQNFAKRTSGFD